MLLDGRALCEYGWSKQSSHRKIRPGTGNGRPDSRSVKFQGVRRPFKKYRRIEKQRQCTADVAYDAPFGAVGIIMPL